MAGRSVAQRATPKIPSRLAREVRTRTGSLAGRGPGMTDRAAQPLEMDLRESVMLRERGAEPAGESLAALGRLLPEVAAGAGEGLVLKLIVVLGFSLIAADHVVADAVPVAFHALEARGRVDIRVEIVFLRADGRGRVAGQAAAVVGLVDDVEEGLVFAVEKDRVVADRRHDGPFLIVGIGAVEEVPGPGESGGDSSDLAQSGRSRRRRPPEILSHHLLGPFARGPGRGRRCGTPCS